MKKDHVPVLNVFMPFATLMYPSLALSMFKTSLQDRGIASKVLYFNFRLARHLGVRRYFDLCEKHIFTYGDFLGEWIFSDQVFTHTPEQVEGYRQTLSQRHEIFDKMLLTDADALDQIEAVRKEIAGYLDACAAEIVSYSPRLVGFSTMFQQHLASLALAKRIKALLPETTVVFGGANCEKSRGIETLRSFPFIDAVILGEGDLVYPEVASRVLSGETLTGIAGVYLQGAVPDIYTDAECQDAPKLENLDGLPIPEFCDYFEELEGVWSEIERIEKRFLASPNLLLETSRGCWWKKNGGCNFCCHSDSQTFRKKSAQRFHDELAQILARYPLRDIWMTDSAMPLEYYTTLMPLLAQAKLGAKLTYYIRVNMTKDQIRTLHEAGVTRIMPGIESFHDNILKVMNKGTTIIQNIQVLKWCREYGMDAGWNLLWGAPGESPADYREVTELLPLLSHLQPPYGFAPIYLGRFSNYHSRPEEFGIRDLAPAEAYRYIYSLPDDAIGRLATNFSFSAQLQPEKYLEGLVEVMSGWTSARGKAALFLVDQGHRAMVLDTRPVATKRVHILTSLQRAIYVSCDSARTTAELEECLPDCTGMRHSRQSIEAELHKLEEERLLIRHKGKAIALAVGVGAHNEAGIAAAIRAFLTGVQQRRELEPVLDRVPVVQDVELPEVSPVQFRTAFLPRG